MSAFKLQFEESEIAKLAEDNWAALSPSDKKVEEDAFEAGKEIQRGSRRLEDLEMIVRWKSARTVHHLKKNTLDSIEKALDTACATTSSPQEALEGLIHLHGVGLPVASAVMTAIYPDRYTIIDFRALESLGHALVDVNFYLSYLEYCKELAGTDTVREQNDYPAPHRLRTLDRALWQWSAAGSKPATG